MKVSNLKAVRHPGLENLTDKAKKNSVNSNKLDNNLSRAKSKIFELTLCNPWDYFCTYTIAPDKYDRYDFKKYYVDFRRFIQNYNRSCNGEEKVRYIIVPEKHQDGAWHMHGFIKGIKQSDIYINNQNYLGWYQYESRFGYISFSKIEDIENYAKYILKYITKDSAKGITDLGMHLYYSSKGLNKATVLFRGELKLNCPWDYETNDGFCKLKYFDIRNDLYKQMIEVIE